MELSDIFFAVLYGGAFILIAYFIFSLIHKPVPSTVVIYDETPVYQESVWWPWARIPYNYWPYWGGWWSGGGDGGYGRRYYGHRWGGDYRAGAYNGGGRPWGGAGRGANAGGFGGGHGGGGGHR